MAVLPFALSLLCGTLLLSTESVGQELIVSPVPDRSRVLTRIAFGSCAKHWQHQPIWDEVIERKPDVFLFLGDAIYSDTDGRTAWAVTEKQLQGEWNRLADKHEFQRFRAQVAILATWDNHDYGTHEGGAEFELKEASKQIFLNFFGEPKNSLRRMHTGIYDSKIFGPEGKRLQVILLDTKFNRSAFRKDPTPREQRLKAGKVGAYLPDDDPDKTHLGKEQWKWLEAEIEKPADLRLVCSSIQVIPDQKGMDEWGNFPRERQRLIDLAEGAGNVILLSGNVHFAEISRLESGVIEFTASGMTHIEEAYGIAPNRFRVAGPLIDLNFGLVEIDWSSRAVSLVACRSDGTAVFRRTVKISALASHQ